MISANTAPARAGEKKDKRKPRPKRPRWWRILFWSLFGLLMLLVVVVTTLLIVLGNLDSPAIRGWVKGYLRDNYKIEVDYKALSVSVFSGLTIEKLSLATPAPYAKHAENLLEVDRLVVDWDFWPLLIGNVKVTEGRLDGLRLSLVTDEHGGSSLSKLIEGFGPPAGEEAVEEAEPVPLSKGPRKNNFPFYEGRIV